jgi:hypothetical protein
MNVVVPIWSSARVPAASGTQGVPPRTSAPTSIAPRSVSTTPTMPAPSDSSYSASLHRAWRTRSRGTAANASSSMSAPTT